MNKLRGKYETMNAEIQVDKVFVRDNEKTFCIPFEACENWLSSKGVCPPFFAEQYKDAAKQIVCETDSRYLVEKKS